MGPTQNDNQDAAAVAPDSGAPADASAAMPPVQVTPPAGGADPGASAAWPQPPAVDPATLAAPASEGSAEIQAAVPTAAPDAVEPNPEDVSMGDEAPAAVPEAPAVPVEPVAPAAPAPAADAAESSDPNPGTPGAVPQQ